MKPALASRRRAAGLLVTCLALTAPAAAQKTVRAEPAPADKEHARSLDLVREHDRVALHPDQPLSIVGLEQGDNGFRSWTPALVRGEHAAPLVDPQDAYARALAMYEKGAIFHQPPQRSSAPEASPRERARARAAAALAAGLSEPEKVSSALLLALGLLFLLAAKRRLRIYQHQRRSAA